MVLKFLTAGIITALLAGGAVYLGLDDDMIAALQTDGETVDASDSAYEVETVAPRTMVDVAQEPVVDKPEAVTVQPEIAKQPVTAPVALAQSWIDFDLLLAEADKLSIPDARDDAYLNILDAALQDEKYEVAKSLVFDLSSPELRDTARQRIGIAYARDGLLKDAFAMVEEVEVEPLSDPIRLEIIRSVARTER
ncbi:MAG: hypothetical protein WBF53_07680 [Litorimonas sp.]